MLILLLEQSRPICCFLSPGKLYSRVCVVVCVDHQSNNLMFTHSICDGVWHVTMNMFHTHTREREREYRTHAEPVEGGVGGQTVGETLCSRVEDPVLPER